MREESFGPIIGIQKVANDEEAVRLMNDTEYGLTAGVYTVDEQRAKSNTVAASRRLGVLELLRPGQPTTAVERRRPFGCRTDLIDLRHRNIHAAKGLASAGLTSAALAFVDLRYVLSTASRNVRSSLSIRRFCCA